jgi:hypothetical protein
MMAMMACSHTMGTQVRKFPYSHDYVHPVEIYEGKFANAYELILYTRPHWLHSFGTRSLSSPVVYMDDFIYGNIYTLKILPIQHISIIQFYNSFDAFYRFGRYHPGGAIVVIM